MTKIPRSPNAPPDLTEYEAAKSRMFTAALEYARALTPVDRDKWLRLSVERAAVLKPTDVRAIIAAAQNRVDCDELLDRLKGLTPEMVEALR